MNTNATQSLAAQTLPAVPLPLIFPTSPRPPSLPGGSSSDASPEIVRGSDGDDRLQRGAGRHVLLGLGGNDHLLDEQGDNLMLGGDGEDVIVGRGTIGGGTGDDDITAAGDATRNVYLYDAGDGHDTIATAGDQPHAAGNGTLMFGRGITPASVSLIREGKDLIFNVSLGDEVKILDWFEAPMHQLQQVRFDDGQTWHQEDIAEMGVAIIGSIEDDVIDGGDESNLIHGGPGDDYIVDRHGDNLIHGGDGNDILIGQGIFDGGHGDDIIHAVGDATTNVYFFDEGDGRDTLYAQCDNQTPEPRGLVGFGEMLAPERLWLRRDGDDLDVSITGSTEGITIKDWYLGSQHRVARFMAGTDQVLDHARVDTLVQAMAQHQVPAASSGGQLPALPQDLLPVLAQAWQ